MNKTKGRFITGADALDGWRDDLLSGKPPRLYPIAESGPLAAVEIGPKLITLIGGGPGDGKTAWVMQSVFEALRITSTLRVVVANVEMPPEVLLERQLSRLAGVPLDVIRHRRIDDEHAGRVDVGLGMLGDLVDRLAFVRPPFDLQNIAATVDSFAPVDDGETVLVVDYLQRIAVPGQTSDRRGSIDTLMGRLRDFADAGVAVVAVSAVGRQRDSKGRSGYSVEAMGLGAFRESSELEFGADSAFIVGRHPDEPNRRTLLHLKARHGELSNIELTFDGSLQRFDVDDYERRDPTGLSAMLSGLWDDTDTAGGDLDD
jgi:replicative DNA helicase